MFERNREVTTIFNIQRHPTHDGPDIHTVIFLRGCSLSCRWCQNPEDRTRTQDLLYDPRLCLEGCGLCAKTAPEVTECALNGLLIHREKSASEHFTVLTDCYPAQTLTVCGEVGGVGEIMATVLHDRPFYDRSGGGSTLFGDKPFMQPETATALLQASHEAGVHTTAEACLHMPWKYIAPSLPYIDLFLADLKHVTGTSFEQWIDGNATRVLDDLKKLVAIGERIIIRVPLIQGFNADGISVKAITDFAASELHANEVYFLLYHILGVNKYHLLNLPYDALEKPLDAPKLLDFVQQYACQKGLAATLRG